MKEYNVEEIRKYCLENRTTLNNLAEKFGFGSRYLVTKFLKDHNIEYLKETKQDISNKLKTSFNERVVLNDEEAEELKLFITKNPEVSYEELMSEFNINSKYKLVKALDKYSITLNGISEHINTFIESIREYISNNRVSERELVKIFNLSSRGELKGIKHNHNLETNPLTRDEVNERISESLINKTQEEKDISLSLRKETNIEKFGHDHHFKNPEVLTKMKDDFESKHGEGITNPFQLDEIKSKRKDTMIDKFGTEYNFQRPEVLSKAHSSLGTMSKPEEEVREWVESLNLKTEKKFIDRLDQYGRKTSIFEIDIFIPERNIGIEFNGMYWHSTEQKDKNYHYHKSKDAERNGIRLIHIFEGYWEQENKREIYKSLIRNALGKPIIKLSASKCELRKIESKEAREFFDTNHLGGYINSSIAYGLFYEGELVQAELFGKPRYTKKIEWESLRGCAKLGYMIYGGYERVLKNFKKEYDPSSIISYVDYNVFVGSLHDHAGFKFIKYSGPDLWYYSKDGELKRYWKVRGNDPKDLQWAKEIEDNIRYKYYFAGSKVYHWFKEDDLEKKV